MAKPAESMLPDGAQDTVSALCWPSDAHIVSSSWDGSVRLHSTDGAPVLKSSYSHKAAVLSVAAASANKVYSGGLDMAVRVCVKMLMVVLSQPALMTCTILQA